MTAVDISAEALELAREQAPNAVFLEADVHDLPLELRRHRFDLAYTGGGVLAWLHDLDAWAGGIAAALKPDGMLFLYDEHPVGGRIDHLSHWRWDYFDEQVDEEKHERHWRLGQIVNAVVDAGLAIRRLEEFRSIYPEAPHDKRIPGQFLLVAEKP